MRVIDVVKSVGITIPEEWAMNPANPKYCYEWCFREAEKGVYFMWEEFSEKDYFTVNHKKIFQTATPRKQRKLLKADLFLNHFAKADKPFRVAFVTAREKLVRGSNKVATVKTRTLSPQLWKVAELSAEGSITIKKVEENHV